MHELVLLLTPTVAVIAGAIFGQLKRKQYFDNLHITLNSRLDELLKTTREQYFAKGMLKGINEKSKVKKTKTKKKPV